VRELASGLWCWRAPHPEWTPGHGWQRDVWAFGVDAEDALVLVDPIAPPEDESDRLAAWIAGRQKRVVIALSRAGHFRDSALFAAEHSATIYGHAGAAARVPSGLEFQAISEGDRLPGGGRVVVFDVPDLDHTPLYFSSHRALAPGDILVREDGELRLWWVPEDEEDVRFLNERDIPAMRRWLESPIDHVLTSHGGPVVGGGGDELTAAFSRPTWAIS
jgi:hypothetical protein